MSPSRWRNILIFTGIVGISALLARYLFPIILPFLLGGALALGAEPAVGLLHKKLKFPRWAAAGAGVTVLFVLALAMIVLLVSLLVRQLGQLSGLLPQLETAVSRGMDALEDWLLSLAGRLPTGIGQTTVRFVESMFSGSSAMLEQVLSRIPQAATGIMGTLGQWALVLFTAILSGYMISSRLPKLQVWCRNKLPKAWQKTYLPALKELRHAVGGWLLAQGKLMGLTFVLLSIGFFILGTPNTLLVAALVTLVDAFPILGTGTVLIPWSIVQLLQGDHAQGIGLLALYAVVWLSRSVLEPKIIGKELGLDPLVTLFSIYAGFCLMGIGGMLIAPIVAMLVVQLFKQRAV